MSDQFHKLFGPDGHIPEEMMLRYVGKQLNAAEEHKVERHTLGCEICSDVLEGLLAVRNREKIPVIIDTIKKEVRLQTSPPQVKVVRMTTRTWVSMAAGLTLVLGLGYFFISQDKDLSSPVTTEELSPLKEENQGGAVTETGKEEPKPENLTSPPGTGENSTLERKGTGTLTFTNESGKEEFTVSEEEVNAPKSASEDIIFTGPDSKVPLTDDLKKNDAAPSETSVQEGDNDLQDVEIENKQQKKSNSDVPNVINKGKTAGKKKRSSVKFGDSSQKEKTKDASINDKAPPEKTVTTMPPPSPNQVIVPTDNNTYNTVPNTSTTTSGNTNNQGYNFGGMADSIYVTTDIHFKQGMTYLDTGKTDLAIAEFLEVIKYPKHPKYEEARWNLALSYLKKGEKEKGKTLLEEISKGTGQYKQQAVKKLEEIK
ncbi:MAG: hypothetical protein IT233_13485 [Bacteroidia bacterium]|nr:hypothetical protein [Bacteroidia bacterium]